MEQQYRRHIHNIIWNVTFSRARLTPQRQHRRQHVGNQEPGKIKTWNIAFDQNVRFGTRAGLHVVTLKHFPLLAHAAVLLFIIIIIIYFPVTYADGHLGLQRDVSSPTSPI